MSSRVPPPRQSAAAALRIPRFAALWAASISTNLGLQIQVVAASWLMLELTGSPLWVALMVAAPRLPVFALSLVSGAVADFIPRRRIIVGASVLMAVGALSMAGLGFERRMGPALLFSLGLLVGAGQAFYLPAWHAMMPDVVSQGLVPSAVALNSAAFNVGRAVGPGLGGVLVAAAGPGVAFAVTAVAYFAMTITTLGVAPKSVASDSRTGPLRGIIALGLRFSWHTPDLRWIFLTIALFAMTSAVVQTLLPNLASDVLGGDAVLYGLLLGAMGLGALGGAFARPHVHDRLGKRMVPTSITLLSLTGVGMGVSTEPVISMSTMLFHGAFWVWVLATLNATAQSLAPEWIRGRVMGLYLMAFVGSMPLGSIIAGSLASVSSIRVATVLLSMSGVLLGIVASRLPLPVLGEERALVELDTIPSPTQKRGKQRRSVLIMSNWTVTDVSPRDFHFFTHSLRMMRMRTGASRWRLYRDTEDRTQIIEMYTVSSWAEHRQQLTRMNADTQTNELMKLIEGLDGISGPVTSHMVPSSFDEEWPDSAYDSPRVVPGHD